MLKTRMTKTAAAARLTAVLMVAVMVCAMFAPAANAATATIAPISDTVRYDGLSAEEIATVQNAMDIQIRNLSAAEANSYILRFGNGNVWRADGKLDGIGDEKFPVMEKLLSANGYPVVSYDNYRGMTGDELAAIYGSNTLEELFLGVGADGKTPVYTNPENQLFHAENNMFLYDKSTGYYKYDSKYNHTYFDTATKSFTLYDSPLRPGAITPSYSYQSFGAFLPFNDITDVVKITDANGVLDTSVLSTSATADKIEFDQSKTENAKPFANLHAIRNDSQNNLADNGFIMKVDFKFFVPKDGKFNGEDMVFHFSGDDDVWVYLDGVLVVDQGGTHRHTESNINFATGAVEYQHHAGANVTKPGNLDARDDAAWPWPWTETTIKAAFDAAGKDTSDFNGDTFADYTEHTFTFVFLERGGEASNCELYFNLPVMPDGALDVMKSVEGELSDVAAAVEYTFVLADEENNPVAGETYSVMHTDGTLTAGLKTDENGCFKLKANEKASFTEIAGDKDYAVVLTEVANDNYTNYNDGTSTTVNGQDSGSLTDLGYTTGKVYLNYDDKKTINFTNDLKELEFGITKEIGEYIPTDEEFTFTVDVIIHEDETNSANNIIRTETITLKGGETKKLSQPVPVGAKVRVTEAVPTGYEASYAVDGADVYTDGNVYLSEPLLLDQLLTVRNELSTSELTITKDISGSLGDRAKQFQFTLNATINNQIVKLEADGLTFDEESGVYSFKLSDDGRMVLSGIPYGAKVKVSEDCQNYTATCGLDTPSAEGTEYTISSMTEDATVAYLNVLDGAPPTGVSLDSLPYVILFMLVMAGAAAMAVSRRRQREFE